MRGSKRDGGRSEGDGCPRTALVGANGPNLTHSTSFGCCCRSPYCCHSLLFRDSAYSHCSRVCLLLVLSLKSCNHLQEPNDGIDTVLAHLAKLVRINAI